MKMTKILPKQNTDFFAVKNMAKIAIKILRCSAFIHNAWDEFVSLCTNFLLISFSVCLPKIITRKRAVARKPRDAAAVLFGLKFADK